MAITIYLGGGEDSEFIPFGSASVNTGGGSFRPSYARCSLVGGTVGQATFGFWQNKKPFSASSFWFTGRRISASSNFPNQSNNSQILAFYDASNILRLLITGTGTAGVYKFLKADSAGSLTQLGSNFTIVDRGATAQNKFDLNIVNAVSGSITVWIDGLQVFTYSGDTTTNGVSTIAYVRLGSTTNIGLSNGQDCWSEIIICDQDTRSLSLQTLAPVANGNTHNFNTGTPAAANVNEVTLSDATLDGSTIAGQIDQYTIPAIVAGSFGILAVGVSARMVKGSSGPSKVDLNVRSSGADYFSADQTLSLSWDTYANWWNADPATSLPWAALPANIGIKSVT